MPANFERHRGGTLTTITGEHTFGTKPKTKFLPLLLVLFIISYGLLTLLVVEQNSTIQNQRALIQLFEQDSAELAHIKESQEYRHLQPLAPLPKSQTAPNQVAPPQNQPGTNKAEKPQMTLPKGIADTPDARRNLSKI